MAKTIVVKQIGSPIRRPATGHCAPGKHVSYVLVRLLSARAPPLGSTVGNRRTFSNVPLIFDIIAADGI